MLPLKLLRVRTRKGQIKPIYAEVNKENLDFARELVTLFKAHVDRRKGNLLEEVSAYEARKHDYRLVRGLSQILQRQCIFQVKASINPVHARKMIFEEASRRNITTKKEREHVLKALADQLNVTAAQLEKSFYGDLDEELVLVSFSPISGVELLKRYNLALTQTLLFRSTFMEIKVTDYWKEILREIKLLGLMYSAESRDGGFTITVDGPLSLFKLTQRYGTRIAEILPIIIQSKEWEISSSIIRTGEFGKRIHQLQLTSLQVGDKIKPAHLQREEKQVSFDSFVEEKFYKDFQSLGTGWKLTREPTPLMAGRYVFLPDFCLEKRSVKVYLEIVGFWTRKYLETKLKKLQQLRGVDILIAADQKLACDKLRRTLGNIIFYARTVPATKILRLLQSREDALLESEVQRLDLKHLHLEGDIVELQTVAEEHGISVEALRVKLKDIDVDGYTLAGNQYIRNGKLQMIKLKIETLTEPSLHETIHLIESEGVKKPYDILSALNYGIRWNGLDLDKSSIYKKEKPNELPKDQGKTPNTNQNIKHK